MKKDNDFFLLLLYYIFEMKYISSNPYNQHNIEYSADFSPDSFENKTLWILCIWYFLTITFERFSSLEICC